MTATIHPAQAKVRRPRASLVLLRIVLVVHAAFVIAQPVAAGYFLSGNVDAMTSIHSPIGGSVWLIAIIQTIFAAAYWLAGRGRAWPTVASAALVVAEFVQLIFGYAQNFAVHIPLGTAIVVTVVWMTVWSFRPTARLNRQEAKS